MTVAVLSRQKLLVVVTAGTVVLGAFVAWRFSTGIKNARARVAHASTIVETRCGPIEFLEAGSGVPLLAVHGSGGGYDQGMAFAAPLAHQGVRVIAMSRFGYLRTPMPADASSAAQADAHVCLLDALAIPKAAVLGGSAGAPSALQMAIRHPTRVSALILLVPLTYKPPNLGRFRACHAAMDREDDDVGHRLGLPVLGSAPRRSRRDDRNRAGDAASAAGARSSTRASAHQRDARFHPAGVSAREGPAQRHGDRQTSETGTARIDPGADAHHQRAGRSLRHHASAEYTAGKIPGAKFIRFPQGGHTWVGHDDAIMAAIAQLLAPVCRPDIQ